MSASQAVQNRRQVLLVDDDKRLLTALRQALGLRGFDVTSACDAGETFQALEEGLPDVIVLDVMMPGLDGFRLCQLLRERISVPILMLTALDSVMDRVQGLQAGADDYLVKPFATDELVARLEALLRRSGPVLARLGNLQCDDLFLNRETWEVTRGGRAIDLTAKEFLILEGLMEKAGRVVSREEIYASAWKEDSAVESNVVDVHIHGLRQKLELAGEPRLLHTVRGAGYMLRRS